MTPRDDVPVNSREAVIRKALMEAWADIPAEEWPLLSNSVNKVMAALDRHADTCPHDEAFRALLDLVSGSMENGSGLFDDDEVRVIVGACQAIGVNPRNILQEFFSGSIDLALRSGGPTDRSGK